MMRRVIPNDLIMSATMITDNYFSPLLTTSKVCERTGYPPHVRLSLLFTPDKLR